MKLLAMREPHTAETHARNRETTTSDGTNDTSGQAFDGVLANVTKKQTQAVPTQGLPDTGLLKKGDDLQTETATANLTDPSALLDAGKSADADLKPISPSSPDETDDTVGALLKRFKGKDDDESPKPGAAGSAPAPALPFFPSPAASTQAKPTVTDGRLCPDVSDDTQTSVMRALDGSQAAGEAPSKQPIQADNPGVLGVSVSTHIAPAKRNDLRPESSVDEQLQPVPNAEGHKVSSNASDGAGGSGHGDRGLGDGRPDASSQIKVEEPVTVATVVPHAPIRSVATAVVELASKASSTAPPGATKPASPAPAHTVTLQLSPGDLGTVEIRMHLSGQALDLQLTISEPRTLGLISRERDTLTKAIETHHYDLNSLVIQDSSATPASGGTHVAKHESSGDAQAEHGHGNSGGKDGSGTPAGREERSGRNARSSAPDDRHTRGDAASRPGLPDERSLFI